MQYDYTHSLHQSTNENAGIEFHGKYLLNASENPSKPEYWTNFASELTFLLFCKNHCQNKAFI